MFLMIIWNIWNTRKYTPIYLSLRFDREQYLLCYIYIHLAIPLSSHHFISSSLLLLFIMLITKSRHDTDVLITCKEFRLLRFGSLELCLNIVLYPIASPSGLFWNHLFYTSYSVYFFNSPFKKYPKSVYFLPPSLLPCDRPLYSPLDT